MNHCILVELFYYQCARRKGLENIVHNIRTNNSVTEKQKQNLICQNHPSLASFPIYGQ